MLQELAKSVLASSMVRLSLSREPAAALVKWDVIVVPLVAADRWEETSFETTITMFHIPCIDFRTGNPNSTYLTLCSVRTLAKEVRTFTCRSLSYTYPLMAWPALVNVNKSWSSHVLTLAFSHCFHFVLLGGQEFIAVKSRRRRQMLLTWCISPVSSIYLFPRGRYVFS